MAIVRLIDTFNLRCCRRVQQRAQELAEQAEEAELQQQIESLALQRVQAIRGSATSHPQSLPDARQNQQTAQLGSSYSPEVLATLDKDLLVQICLQADAQRRSAIGAQMQAQAKTSEAQQEAAELRNMVNVLQSAIEGRR